jgi:hypothetical protein
MSELAVPGARIRAELQRMRWAIAALQRALV